MAIYTFINGVRKRAFTYNPRVVVGGTVRKIIAGYTFINGVRKQLFNKWSFDHTEVYLSNGTETLPFGNYQIVCRGAGGAGGTNGANGAASQGGNGGAGAKGALSVNNISLQSATTVNVFPGASGKTYSNGGNGGVGGSQVSSAGAGGNGGGGGHVSYALINSTYYSATGGGGGGGGGGGTENGRFSGGGSGGGGGGYYRFNGGSEVSVAGKNGARGKDSAGYGNATGVAGNTTDFPNLRSGNGGKGFNVSVARGANGGGASGAGGGGGKDNDAGWWGAGGGGGAGGSADAGGGQGGFSPAVYDGVSATGQDGTNFHTVPTDTLAENQQYGVNANYGIGGYANQNGSQGFVVIRRVS